MSSFLAANELHAETVKSGERYVRLMVSRRLRECSRHGELQCRLEQPLYDAIITELKAAGYAASHDGEAYSISWRA